MRLFWYRSIATVLLGMLSLASGCTLPFKQNFRYVKPLRPKQMQKPEECTLVDSLRPTFAWKPILEGTTPPPDYYEFAIWEFLGLRPVPSEAVVDFSTGELGVKYVSSVMQKKIWVAKVGWVPTGPSESSESAYLFYVLPEPCYLRPRVIGNTHKVDDDLKPNTSYIWNVRPVWKDGHRKGEPGEYHFYSTSAMIGFHETIIYNVYGFTFRTPRK